MDTESYHGFRIDDEPDTRIATQAVRDHWFNVYEEDALAFRVRMRVRWDFPEALQAGINPVDAAAGVAERHGRRWVHGLIDLGEWSPGQVHEETRDGSWDLLAGDRTLVDADLRLKVLGALQRMRRAERESSAIFELDVQGLATVLSVPLGRIRGVLGELIDEGLVEAAYPTFGTGAEDGACRITGNGLRALQESQPAPSDIVTAPVMSEPTLRLRAILFTDVVGSTETNEQLGNRAWKQLAEQHHAIIRNSLERHGGVEVDTAGDGFFATFDTPTQAITCALAIVEEVRRLGIEVRAGIHSGECTVIDGKDGGLAVSIGARVGALAGSSEVLVSGTVRDLLAGSEFVFEDRGLHVLKGVSGHWPLFAVVKSR